MSVLNSYHCTALNYLFSYAVTVLVCVCGGGGGGGNVCVLGNTGGV